MSCLFPLLYYNLYIIFKYSNSNALPRTALDCTLRCYNDFVDTIEEKIAVHEATKLDIPVIGILDTNGDPDAVDIPIPANDDSIRAIHLITKTLADTIMEAKRGSKKQKKEDPVEVKDLPKEPKKEK